MRHAHSLYIYIYTYVYIHMDTYTVSYVCIYIYHPYVCIYDTYIHTSIICSAYNIALIYTCVIFRFFLHKSDLAIFLSHKEMHPVSSGAGHLQWQLGAPVSLPCSLHPCSSWNLHEGSQVVERGEPWNQQNRFFSTMAWFFQQIEIFEPC